ncbi:MAG: T9SS type A sorting domain-containing protein [Cytophagales bacterium]|nr:T9SS type A sorting domain-containing protein [Cytophagales bacterium]
MTNRLDVSKLPDGVYILTLKGNSKSSRSRIVVIH